MSSQERVRAVTEMNDQIRAVVFILLALLILFRGAHFLKPPVPAPQQTPAANSRRRPGRERRDRKRPQRVSSALPSCRKQTSVGGRDASRGRKNNRGGKPALSRGVFESRRRGAELETQEISDDQKPPHPLDLGEPDAAKQLGWPFSLVLTDKQLEAQANSALYEVIRPRQERAGNCRRRLDVTFHWSDGHVDVMKKLIVHTGLRVDGGVHGYAGRQADSGCDCVARRIRRQGGLQSVAARYVFYKQNDKLNLLQYKKLGVSGNQAQPCGAARADGILGHRGSVLYGDVHSGRNRPFTVALDAESQRRRGGQAVSEPEAEMAAGTTELGSAAGARVRWPEGPGAAEQGRSRRSRSWCNFGWTGIIAKPMLFVICNGCTDIFRTTDGRS